MESVERTLWSSAEVSDKIFNIWIGKEPELPRIREESKQQASLHFLLFATQLTPSRPVVFVICWSASCLCNACLQEATCGGPKFSCSPSCRFIVNHQMAPLAWSQMRVILLGWKCYLPAYLLGSFGPANHFDAIFSTTKLRWLWDIFPYRISGRIKEIIFGKTQQCVRKACLPRVIN